MRNLVTNLFSLSLTVVLALSYVYEFEIGLLFVSAIMWAMVLIVSLLVVSMMFILSKYDDGELSNKQCERHFGNIKNPSVISRLYSLIMTFSQTFLLVLLDSPVLAAFYFMSNIVADCLLGACRKRANDWAKKK